MKKNKPLGLSIFYVVLTIVLIALTIFTVGVNYIFGSSVRSGNVFGKNIFIMNSDIMEPELKKGVAIISESDEISVLIEGNVILFNEDTGFENVMRIVEVIHNTDQTVYRVAGDNAQDNVLNVPKENVIAKCTKVIPNLGKTITFLKSITGILLGMILPCIILLVMLLVKIFSVRRKNRMENDEIVYPETSFGIGNSSKGEDRDHSSNPLFDPSTAPKPGASFAMKKSSIAENFSMKTAAKKTPTNPIERIQQKENAVEKFRAAVDEKPAAPISRKASLAPDSTTSDKTEKMAAIKAALDNSDNEQTIEKPVNSNAEAFEPFEPPTEDTAKTEVIPEPVKQESVPKEPPKPKTAHKRKQDNIKSIDDLIKALEEEKKKL